MSAPDANFVRQYQNSIYLLAQQLDSRMMSCFQVDMNFVGEKKFYDQYGLNTFSEIMSRFADTPIGAADHRRRMVTPRYFVSNLLVDPKDALQMIIDPKTPYMQANQAGANRTIDDVAISAFGSSALTGKDGTVSVAFTSGNQILSSSAGMTKAKCISAKRLLDGAEVDKVDRYMAHSAAQLEDLLALTEVTSSDYNVVKSLVQGELNTWLGFLWVHTERLLTNGSSERLCYAWQKKGMQLAFQKAPEGRLDERPDKNYAWQVYMRLCLGAARLEESRVVQLACVEQAQ